MTSSAPASRLLQIIGGAGMILASFLQWASTTQSGVAADGSVLLATATANGWDVGMLGLWQTIMGVIIILAALRGLMNSEAAPGKIFGFSFDQALIVLAFPALLWNFGLQFDQIYGGIGLLIGWISAALTIAGSELQRTGSAQLVTE